MGGKGGGDGGGGDGGGGDGGGGDGGGLGGGDGGGDGGGGDGGGDGGGEGGGGDGGGEGGGGEGGEDGGNEGGGGGETRFWISASTSRPSPMNSPWGAIRSRRIVTFRLNRVVGRLASQVAAWSTEMGGGTLTFSTLARSKTTSPAATGRTSGWRIMRSKSNGRVTGGVV